MVGRIGSAQSRAKPQRVLAATCRKLGVFDLTFYIDGRDGSAGERPGQGYKAGAADSWKQTCSTQATQKAPRLSSDRLTRPGGQLPTTATASDLIGRPLHPTSEAIVRLVETELLRTGDSRKAYKRHPLHSQEAPIISSDRARVLSAYRHAT